MTKRLRIASLALAVVVGVLVLAQCVRHKSATAGTLVIDASGACPKTDLGPLGLPGVGRLIRLIDSRLIIATSVSPSDTSTSIVIHPDPADQIKCGKTKVQLFPDVVFNRPHLPSGKALALALDVLVPEGAVRRPLVVYVPGGGFIRAPKAGALELRTFVAEAGFVVASIEYRTQTNGATYKDGIADAKAAIRFLRANADRYGIDPNRVAVWGESAGGYVAAMTGLTNTEHAFDLGDNLGQSSEVQGVIDKFGSSDASKITADFDQEAQQASVAHAGYINLYMGAASEKEPPSPASNPLSHIVAGDPPFLIFHGSEDKMISPSQTLILHNALRAAGVPSTRYVLEGAGHGDLAFLGDKEAGLPWSSRQTMALIVDFLEHLPERAQH